MRASIISNRFPMYYQTWVSSHKKSEDFLYNFQFTHKFYEMGKSSSYFFLMEPLLEFINPISIVRIKSNFLPVTKKIIKFAHHRDYDNFSGKSAVFYLNTNNGYTFFKDIDVKVESVENRLLIFDSDLLHSGTTCTDEKYRLLINLNYFPYTNNEFPT